MKNIKTLLIKILGGIIIIIVLKSLIIDKSEDYLGIVILLIICLILVFTPSHIYLKDKEIKDQRATKKKADQQLEIKRIIEEQDTISGKTALFRYFLSFVVYALLLYLMMPNDFFDLESKEVYNMRYFFREDRYLDLLKYSILTIPFWIIIINTIFKRLSSFHSSKNRVISYFSKYQDNIIGPTLGLPILFSEIKILSVEMEMFFSIIFYCFFFIFAIIPTLINSPITDYKNHKG